MKKRQLSTLSFYDHTGIEKHLAAMARQGWLIERITNFFWTYRKIEPQQLHFTVSYYSKASDFDPAPSEGQQSFMDFCAETGWEPVCTWFQMQIFCSSAAEPIPIHTDPALEVTAIHKACKANFLRSYSILLAISLIFAGLFLSSLISDTLRLLASPVDLVTGLCWVLLFAQCARELCVYHLWYRNAKKAAEHGIFLDTPSNSAFQKILCAALGLCFLYWFLHLIFGRDPLTTGIALAASAGCFITAVLVSAVKQLLKKKQVSAARNKLVTVLSSFVIAFVINIVLFFGIDFIRELPRERLPLQEEPPLQISDLLETEYSNYLTTGSPKESLFVLRLDHHQQHGFDDEASPEIPELNYELYAVKVPALYSFCENQMKRLIVLSAFWNGHLTEEPAAPWGADRAYRLVMDDGSERPLYLLCYENILLEIEFSWQPTAGQMRIVGEKIASFSSVL